MGISYGKSRGIYSILYRLTKVNNNYLCRMDKNTNSMHLIVLVIGGEDDQIEVSVHKVNNDFSDRGINVIRIKSPQEGMYDGAIVEELTAIELNLEKLENS